MARLAGGLYVSFFRGVPLLVQLLLVYYALPFVGLELPSFLAAAIGLARLHRGLSGGKPARRLPRHPPRADRGGARLRLWRRRRSGGTSCCHRRCAARLPAIVNEMIAILKASSLVSVVGVADLTRVSQNIVARDLRPIQWYGLAALLYLAISLAVAALGRGSERRLGRGTLRAAL